MLWIINKVRIIWQTIKMSNTITNAFLLLLFLLLVFILWGYLQQSIFALKVIYVKGISDTPLRHINASIIRTLVIPHVKNNFFTIDLNKTSIIFESIPWVHKVIIRRKWPNSLIVEIEEHDILGTWGKDGRFLSVKGDIFIVNFTKLKNNKALLECKGPKGSEQEIVKHYIQFSNLLLPMNLTLSAIIFSYHYGWHIKLNNGMTIALGRSENNTILKERITRFIFIYPRLIQHLHGKVLNIDLRYSHGFTLKIANYISCNR